MNTLKRWAAYIFGGLVLVAFVGFVGWYSACVNFVENYQLGYAFDGLTGKIYALPHTGYIVTPIWVKVNTIDLRPMQVCINANARVLNCKLVEFDPKGLDLFLSWHGRDWHTSSQLDQILMSYAYDGTGRSYPFLKVLRELKTDILK